MFKLDDLTDRKFGKLLVIKRAENTKDGKPQWLCRCDCDIDGTNLRVVSSSNLRRGSVKGCGCVLKEWNKETKTKHGLKKTRAYKSWLDMRRRCLDVNHNQYKHYGGRGIKVCDEWVDNVTKFYEDMGECPEGYSIERIDVDGDYCKENCCWIPKEKQARNKRNLCMIEYNGEIKPRAEWAEIFGIRYNTFKRRIERGWNIAQIIGEEPRKGKYYDLRLTYPVEESKGVVNE